MLFLTTVGESAIISKSLMKNIKLMSYFVFAEA